MSRHLFVAFRALVFLAVAGFLTSGPAAQSPPSLAGTWKINLAKSKYDPPTQAPKTGTVKIEVTGDTIKVVNDGVDAAGRVGKLKGQPLGTQRIVMAADGKSRTNYVTGKNPQGQTVTNTVVLERQ